MKIAIIGYGVEGKSAEKYYQAQHANITICDVRTSLETPANTTAKLGENYLEDLDGFDLIVRSPGVNPNLILAKNPRVKAKITTLVNEFLKISPTKNIIGITGTKGKGTTTTLIAKMLEAAGKQVFTGGNIGLPPFEFLSALAPESWVVLELSSFQLYDLTRSPHIAVCLMIAPEHLDWHSDMADYTNAKAQLFSHQTPDDIAIFLANNPYSKSITDHSPGTKLPYFASPGAHIEAGQIVIDGHTICSTDDLKLLGKHNWQNACAAVTAVWQATQEVQPIRAVLTSFSGLEHRLELVREVDGVKYYDDSFGTTPETTIVAIDAFTQPKVLILGGSDKGTKFDELAATIKNADIRQVILIGNTTNSAFPTVTHKIEAALRAQGITNLISLVKPNGPSMTEIIATAQKTAHPGDVVLLSCACASFDMFKNYQDRGNQFKAGVNVL